MSPKLATTLFSPKSGIGRVLKVVLTEFCKNNHQIVET